MGSEMCIRDREVSEEGTAEEVKAEEVSEEGTAEEVKAEEVSEKTVDLD